MASLVVAGDVSGSVTLSAPSAAGSTVITLPTTSGTMVVTGGAQTVQFAAGSAASPSITFTGDTNTGIFSPTADTIGFSEGGVESMRIDSSGNVGIGTSSPSNRLHISQSLAGTPTSSAGIVRIANTRLNTGDGAATLLFVTDEVDGSTQDKRAQIGAEYDGTNGGRLVFSTAQTSTKTITERMRITSAGDVGIGTTSPSVRLQVNGGVNSAHLVLTGTAGRGLRISTSNPNGQNDGTVIYNAQDTENLGQHIWQTGGTERMRITSSGEFLVGKTSLGSSSNGFEIFPGTSTYSVLTNGRTDNDGDLFILNRQGSDGRLINFLQANTSEGNISVSGTTVSYNGGHLSRWSQLPNNQKDDTILKGTVMSNLDDMCVWVKDGETLPNEQLNKMKVSDVEGDTNVAGVFVNWTFDEQCQSDDMNVAMTGDMIIRIAEGVVVQKGDLLMSAGDGTAKPQGDDIRRSKTVAKVTSNHVTCTYEDGSYCVPCVLMAC